MKCRHCGEKIYDCQYTHDYYADGGDGKCVYYCDESDTGDHEPEVIA